MQLLIRNHGRPGRAEARAAQGRRPHPHRHAGGRARIHGLGWSAKQDWRPSWYVPHHFSGTSPSCHLLYDLTRPGSVLGTALRPIGAPLEKGLTGPLGNAVGGATRPALGPLLGEDHEKSELLGGKNKDSYESKPESIAGKEQTGENPLGLDQTGRWGFEGDDKK